MGILKRRSMLVSFRVSVEEHDQLQASCLRSGARSISDFVRIAALQRVEILDSPGGGLSGDLMTLTKGLRELDLLLGSTRKQIRAVVGPIPRAQDNGGDVVPGQRRTKRKQSLQMATD